MQITKNGISNGVKKLIILLLLPILFLLSGCAYKIVKNDSETSVNKEPVISDVKQSNPLDQVKEVPETKTAEVIDFTEAGNFVGENKTVRGQVVKVYYSAKSDTTFLNFCSNYQGCPFSSVVFSSDKSKFGDLNQYEGKTIEITGLIKTYKGSAEIILNNPNQIKIIE